MYAGTWNRVAQINLMWAELSVMAVTGLIGGLFSVFFFFNLVACFISFSLLTNGDQAQHVCAANDI